MFENHPRTFDTVVNRDFWLWDHTDASPILILNEDRLLSFPDYSGQSPSGYEWVQYGISIASMLEEQQKWPEAQAYWYASAFLLAQDGKKSIENFEKVIIGIIRTGGCSAGMPFNQENDDLEDLIEIGALSLSTPIQEAIIRSLLLAGTLQPDIYETAVSSPIRKIYAQELTKLNYHKQDSSQQKRKGSHEIFPEIIQSYTQDITQMRALIDGIAMSPTLEYIKNQREKILRIIGQLKHINFAYDNLLISMMQDLLASKFTHYVRYSDEINEEAFDDFMQSATSLLKEAKTSGSYMASCVFAPLTLSIEAAVNAHYQGNVASKIPELKVYLLKPLARHAGIIPLLDIEISNDGTMAADDCELFLRSSEQIEISFDPTNLWFGRIEPGYPRVQQCQIHCSLERVNYDIEYTLEWRDRRGIHSKTSILKIIWQQSINWNHLELIEAPYTIQSITDPQKLKGRDEQIATLRFGFQGKNSFLLTGQKRVGKTSLVQVFLSQLNLMSSILPLYIPIGELSAASYDDLGRLGWELTKRIVEGYKIKFHSDAAVPIPNLETFRDSFNSTFPEFIREFLRVHSLRIVFALDDFDELSTLLFTGPVGKAFFLALRALINNGITFLFIGSERLPAIISEQAERLNQVKSLKVDYLSREAIVALVREPVKQWLEYTDDAIVEIEMWSARNPYFATLICNAIWERALKMHDCWITKRDVEQAVRNLAKTSDRNSYQHFWSDSPLGQEEERSIYAIKSIYIILAIYKLQPNSLAFAQRQTVVKNCEGLNASEADQHLQELINYNVIETNREQSDLIRLRVPLFTLWLQEDGAAELRQSAASKDRLNNLRQQSNELTHNEVIEVTEGLSYRGEKITTDQVRAWASQFGPVRDQRLMLKLLKGVRDNGLFNESKLTHALRKLHEMARQEAADHGVAMQMGARNSITNWYVTHIDPTGKSGSSIAKQYRSLNSIPASQCGDSEKVLTAMMNSRNRRSVLICVDDFVGSGFSATKDLNSLISSLDEKIEGWRDKILIIYATVVGFEDGINAIKDQFSTDVTVINFKILTSAEKAFNEENSLFSSADERIQAQDIVSKIGKVLEKRHPLGWEDSQALVVFTDNVPNNTLPIFFKDGVEYNGKKWKALFPRS